MNKIFKNILLLSCVAAVFTSCDNFVFGNVHVDYNENPLESKGLARSGADRYVDSVICAQKPKLADFIFKMRKNIANVLETDKWSSSIMTNYKI